MAKALEEDSSEALSSFFNVIVSSSRVKSRDDEFEECCHVAKDEQHFEDELTWV